MDYSSKERSMMQSNIRISFLRSYILKALEEETDKPESEIDPDKIRSIVKLLDIIDGMEELPEEFKIDNFTKRFYQTYQISPVSFIYPGKQE